ncbi:MAG: cytochrome b N-terminal domain-containing protein [Anaerolineales bacterium]
MLNKGMRSAKRAWDWIEERTGIWAAIKPLAEHPVPPGTNWWYVFGSATLFTFIVQAVTGATLASVYTTSSGNAYESLRFITEDAYMGNVLRGIHFWGASAMVLFVGIHMMRVFLTGAYKFPREFNWLTGGFLLLLTIAMGFTGQLLRWDQNAIWTVVVGAEQAGRAPLIGNILGRFLLAGETIGGATLSRFFSYHVFMIPALLIGLIGAHLYLVIRNGVSEPVKRDQVVEPKTYRSRYQAILQREGERFWPDVAWRDVAFGFLVVVGIVILAIIVGPPALTNPPDPSIVQAEPRPDWYLLWYFAVLALIPPGLEPYVIIGAPLLFGLALLLLPFIAGKGQRHPLQRPWAMATALLAVMMIGILWYMATKAPWSPDFNAKPLNPQQVGAESGPLWQGSQLFAVKGCQYCHTIDGQGGQRGPDLTAVGDRLTDQQITIRILNGATNMPAYGGNISSGEVDLLVQFLSSRHGQ